MVKHKVRNFIFSSTAAIFANPVRSAIDEKHPQDPINPYGRSKWMVERLLPDCELAYKLRFVCLRYFNAAGAQPDGSLGERHDPETHLIPLAINAAVGRSAPLKIFGSDSPTPDGTCVRDHERSASQIDFAVYAINQLIDRLRPVYRLIKKVRAVLRIRKA